MTPTLLWLIAGVLLCLVELVLPSAFVAFMMGIGALVVAALSRVLPQVSLQILLWMGISLGLVVGARRVMPQRRRSTLQDATEAETLTEILAGKPGRVLYEGNSWQARCDDPDLTIAAHQPVYVVERRGTTLIVMPKSLLHS